MGTLLAALWILVASSVTVMPVDELPDDWTNEFDQMVLGSETEATDDDRVLDAALGCHGADDIRYYQRPLHVHLADVQREHPAFPLVWQMAIAQQRYEDMEYHELVHAAHCRITGDMSVGLSRVEARKLYKALGLDPRAWKPRPENYFDAKDILRAVQPNIRNGNVRYCYQNEAEWLACLTTAVAHGSK